MLEFEPDPPAPAPPPPAPRVLIVGDSWIAGLAVAPGKSFAHLVAAELGAEQVLDLSGVSKTTGQAVTQDADRIRAFAPTLAIICCGGTEALVHPGPLVRDALDRWGPPSWKGITGLEPRARYSTSVSRRVRQRSATLLKIVAKRAIIFLTGGKRRMPLAEWRRDLDALIALLAEVGCAMAFIGMWRVDDRMFPGTQAALDETHAELVEAVAGRDDAVLVHIREHLHYFDDFLKDNLHLTVDGHRRVAGLVLAGCRQLTEG
jgi:lysophospholipase L1-like esterase